MLRAVVLRERRERLLQRRVLAVFRRIGRLRESARTGESLFVEDARDEPFTDASRDGDVAIASADDAAAAGDDAGTSSTRPPRSVAFAAEDDDGDFAFPATRDV